jgi:riboflavin synthase
VDGVGRVLTIESRQSSWFITVEFPGEFGRYVVPVGSIAIDGVSLTVASTSGNTLSVSLIPHTYEKTTLSSLVVGSPVNLEFDLMGKYIERLMVHGPGEGGEGGAGITAEKLKEWGYLR